MKKPSFRLVLVGVVSMAVLLGTGMLTPSTTTVREPASERFLAGRAPLVSNYGNHAPPASGDWIITEDTRVVDLECTVNGSIVIASSNINLTFVGGNVSFAVGDHGVRIQHVSNVTIDGIRVISGTRALVTIDDSTNITIQNAFFRGFYYNDTEAWVSGGISSHFSHNVTVVNTTIQDTMASVFIVNGTDWVFDTCVFELTPGSQFDDGELQFIQQCARFTIINCVLRNLIADGIEIYDGSDFHIENNTIIDCGTGVFARRRDFDDPLRRITIINNTLVNAVIHLTDVDDCLIDGNDMQGAESVIWLFNSSNIVISNNWLDSPPAYNVMEDDTSTNITVIDNHFYWAVPDQVTGLVATGGNGSVSLAWDAPSHGSHPITNYTIYWREGWDPLNELHLGNVTEYLHAGLDNGKEYRYMVAAINDAGSSENSSMVSATTWGVPGQVTGLLATPGDGHVNLTWHAPDSDGGRPVTGYVINWTRDFVVFDQIHVGNVTEYQHAGLDNGGWYHPSVHAINDMGPGEPSMFATAFLEGDEEPTGDKQDPGGPESPPPINAAPVLLVIACTLCGIVGVASRLGRRRD